MLFLVLGVLLLRRGMGVERAVGGDGRSAFLTVYVFAAILLFTASGVYHMMARGGLAERVLLRIDHAMIFVLIAGTFTPAHGIVLRGWRRWGPLGVIWAAAAVGIVLRTGSFERPPPWVGLGMYLAMGWFGVVSGVMVAGRLGWWAVMPLLAGGVLYSVGAVMEPLRLWWVVPGVVGPHELFHVMVVAGAVTHWAFVWKIAAIPGAGQTRDLL